MKIGELAARSGASAATIRFYENKGLLPEPERADGKQRVYDADDLARLDLVRRCRWLGFSIDEIRHLVSLGRQRGPSSVCRSMLRERMHTVREQIKDLQRVEARLADLLAEKAGADEPCARLDALR